MNCPDGVLAISCAPVACPAASGDDAGLGRGLGIDRAAAGIDLIDRRGDGGVGAADKAQITIGLFADRARGLGGIDRGLVAGEIGKGGRRQQQRRGRRKSRI